MSDQKKDARYNKKRWRKQANKAKQKTYSRCCLCGSEAKQVHHAYYGLRLLCFHLPIAGWEIPGWQIFPLCAHHHSNSEGCAHNFNNYQVDKTSSWNNRNTDEFLWRLRLGYATTLLAHNVISFLINRPRTVILLGLSVWFGLTTFVSPSSPRSQSHPFQLWQNEPPLLHRPNLRRTWPSSRDSVRVPIKIRSESRR